MHSSGHYDLLIVQFGHFLQFPKERQADSGRQKYVVCYVPFDARAFVYFRSSFWGCRRKVVTCLFFAAILSRRSCNFMKLIIFNNNSYCI